WWAALALVGDGRKAVLELASRRPPVRSRLAPPNGRAKNCRLGGGFAVARYAAPVRVEPRTRSSAQAAFACSRVESKTSIARLRPSSGTGGGWTSSHESAAQTASAIVPLLSSSARTTLAAFHSSILSARIDCSRLGPDRGTRTAERRYERMSQTGL